jgi:hypothetical protein
MIKIGKDELICHDKTIMDAEYTVVSKDDNNSPTPLTLFHMVTPSP